MKNKNKVQKPTKIFALRTDFHNIRKHPVDDNGNIINSEFNARTFAKKAYEAYLKHKSMFIYKGHTYIVPTTTEEAINKLMETED